MLDREEGIEIGFEQGMERGRHQEALEIAREMKKDQFSIEQISKLTKLSFEEIEALV
jgi:predicted transposase/invertase (TIGR01784 family)